MRQALKFLLLLFALGILFSPVLLAEYKFFDQIEEFGEKRYIKSVPTKLIAGPVRFHPQMRTKAAYDSNILRDEEDPRDDVVFNIQPGAVIELPVQDHQFVVGYQADFENFIKKKSSSQKAQNQDMFGLIDLHFPSFYVNVLEKFSDTSSRSGTTFTNRIPRRDQSISPKMGYRWKRAIFETGFQHFTRDFRRQIDDSLDFQTIEMKNVIFYDLFAQLKALLEYHWGQIDYDDNTTRRATINQARVGLEGELLPNVVVKVRTGFQIRNYLVSSENDFNSWVGSASVEYQMRDNLLLKISTDRDPVEATFQDVNYYTNHILRLGAEYEFIPRWTLFTMSKVYWHRYSERSLVQNQLGYRRDKHLSLELGMRYDFREWWDIELAYELLHRTSSIPDFDYTDHQVSLTSAFHY
jgi:hypothetical protein